MKLTIKALIGTLIKLQNRVVHFGTEYEILSSLSTTPEIDEQAYQMELKTLIKERLISHNVTGETYSQIIYHGFLVTSL